MLFRMMLEGIASNGAKAYKSSTLKAGCTACCALSVNSSGSMAVAKYGVHVSSVGDGA